MAGGSPGRAASARPPRSRRWAWRSPRGSRSCCGAPRAPARRRSSGPWPSALGWPCETVIASIREPSDFAGLPVVVGDGVRFAPPAWARRLAEAGRGLLFLDELSTAPPAVQAALLRVVLERVVGDLELPPEVAVVAAANPPEQAADGWDLSAPLANRLCHLSWDDRPAGGGGRAGRRLGAAARCPHCPTTGGPNSAWPSPWWPRSCTSARPGLRPAVRRGAAGRGWPSPRTWEMAARLLGRQRRRRVGRGSAGRPGPRRGGRGRGGGVPGLGGRDGPA